jgi:hypothetical protein
MSKYEFQIVLADIVEVTEEISCALFEAGCNDGTPMSSGGIAAIGFTRDAASLEEAVRSAIVDVERGGQKVARVESPDQPLFSRINAELANA